MRFKLRLSALVLLLSASCGTIAADSLAFSPAGCEFSVKLPSPARIENHMDPASGRRALQAVTTNEGFPWFVAQCTTGDDGSPPPDLKERTRRIVDLLRSRGGTGVKVSTVKDGRGEWTKATGIAIVSDHTLHLTAANFSGASSMLLLFGAVEKTTDQELVDRVFNSAALKTKP
jgi:hypothetical protein